MPFGGSGRLKKAHTSGAGGATKEAFKDRLIVLRKIKEDPDFTSRRFPDSTAGKVTVNILDVESGEVHEDVVFYSNLAQNIIGAGEIGEPLLTKIIFGGDLVANAQWWGLINEEDITAEEEEEAEAALAKVSGVKRASGASTRKSGGVATTEKPPF